MGDDRFCSPCQWTTPWLILHLGGLQQKTPMKGYGLRGCHEGTRRKLEGGDRAVLPELQGTSVLPGSAGRLWSMSPAQDPCIHPRNKIKGLATSLQLGRCFMFMHSRGFTVSSSPIRSASELSLYSGWTWLHYSGGQVLPHFPFA